MKDKKITYSSSGVNYDVIDPLKILAQKAAAKTMDNLQGSGYRERKNTRGESVYFIQAGFNRYITFVQEGLGTKNLVADRMHELTGKSYYNHIAQDTVAAIINDLITIGSRPLGLNAYWAIGSSDWFKDKDRMSDLVEGWREACNLAGVAWGGGETPVLSGIVNEGTIDLAGAAFGVVSRKQLTLGDKLEVGDSIVVFESSGIHANGLTLARRLAEGLPKGYLTPLFGGPTSPRLRGASKTYGEALLEPSIIYARLIQSIFKSGVDIHYMVHITGHGWRKLMRNKKDFTYRIHDLPPVPTVLAFIQKEAHMSDEEAYGTFNMGAGFAVFVAKKDVEKVIEAAQEKNIKAYNVGAVEKGPKQVIIEPKNITFTEETLQVRA